MRLLIEIRRIGVSFGIAGFFTVMHKPTAVIHSYPQKSPQVFDISSRKRKKRAEPALTFAKALQNTKAILTRAALRNSSCAKKRGEVEPLRALFMGFLWIFYTSFA